ncbi:hypothetical protein GM528_12420 [Streptococcus pneumoniae]|nr:hypothetical protein [Streptococcus pneumoniae]
MAMLNALLFLEFLLLLCPKTQPLVPNPNVFFEFSEWVPLKVALLLFKENAGVITNSLVL